MLRAAGPGRVGFKLRLGLSAERPVLPDLALRLEDLGAGWLTLHPRTARQAFNGAADWTACRALRRAFPCLCWPAGTCSARPTACAAWPGPASAG